MRALWQARAEKRQVLLAGLPESLEAEQQKLRLQLLRARANDASMGDVRALERELAAYPKTVEQASMSWSKARDEYALRAMAPQPHATPFASRTNESADVLRNNFLAIVLCLMMGTAGLPHILMRSFTTPSVDAARKSVFWSLFFILLLYLMAPALAILVKFEIYANLVGSQFTELPSWVHAWSAVDRSLLSIVDLNKDNIVQLAEIQLGADVVVLAGPEIGGLPYVVSGMVAAGGLAAALSTADGLLLTIANALSHDLYYKVLDPNASTARRVMVSKMLLLVVALAAAYVAAQKPADILFLVSAAFSFAAAAFFPALTLGIFWKRANKWGASLGMVAGLGITFYYMVTTQPWLYKLTHGAAITPEIVKANTWWDIAPISAGLFGVPLGFAVIIIVSLLTKAPGRDIQELVEHVRYPSLDGKTSAGSAAH